MNIDGAGRSAYEAQIWDDGRAENVAFIFIEDAMKAFGIPEKRFSDVEAVADRLWARRRRKR